MGRYSDTDAVIAASRALLALVSRSVMPVLGELSLAQFRVLVVLVGLGPQRFGALAERLDVNTSTFSRSVDRLEQQGWVVRTPSPDSRREVIVEATDDARRIVQSVTDARRQEVVRILERIPGQRRRAVAEAFEEFAAAAGEPAYEDLLPFAT